jgi:hypothetical protein
MANLNSSQVQPAQHSSVVDYILKFTPLDILLPMAFSAALNTIKNPATKMAKTLKPILVNFAKSIIQKYPDDFAG